MSGCANETAVRQCYCLKAACCYGMPDDACARIAALLGSWQLPESAWTQAYKTCYEVPIKNACAPEIFGERIQSSKTIFASFLSQRGRARSA